MNCNFQKKVARSRWGVTHRACSSITLRELGTFVLLIGLICLWSGCRPHIPLKVGDSEDDPFRNAFSSRSQVVLVCVFENQLHKRALPKKHFIESKATVVRSCKGAWKIGEMVTFSRQLESVPDDWVPTTGHLLVLFLDEHSSRSLPLDTGDTWPYSAEIEQALRER